MTKRAWQRKTKRKVSTTAVPDDLHETLVNRSGEVVARLKKKLCRKPKNPKFNWCSDLFVRPHRGALYVVAVYSTPHGIPESFESHAARIKYSGNELFETAVPMRRGWNTVGRKLTVDQAVAALNELVSV